MRFLPMSQPRERTNEAWIRDLSAPGAPQAAAIEDLRALLIRGALYALHRTPVHGTPLRRGPAEEIAEECAQEALVAILARLDEFRSESRFTTWAWKFAVNFALTAARRERWKAVPLETLLDDRADMEGPASLAAPGPSPERLTAQEEAWALVRTVMDEQLTARQRQVLQAMVIDDLPLDEVVRHLGSNRNAVYKLVHDARRKLKAGLEERGYPAGEILALFEAPG
jgi:RNA polymerase sigma-70 factor (ECF subfamily)